MCIIKGQKKDTTSTFPHIQDTYHTDFAKKNIFHVLQAYIDFEEVTTLDLFAGTGSITRTGIARMRTRC